jgi:hypothetical protein
VLTLETLAEVNHNRSFSHRWSMDQPDELKVLGTQAQRGRNSLKRGIYLETIFLSESIFRLTKS